MRRVPEPGYVQPLTLYFMSDIEQSSTLFPQTYFIGNVLMPRFTVWLIPIDVPESMDTTRGVPDIRTSIWSPDSDTLNLDRHVHTRVHVGPAFRDIPQCSLVFAFPIGTTIRRRQDVGVPECALGNMTPPLPLFPEEYKGHSLGQEDDEKDDSAADVFFGDYRAGAGG